MNTQPGVSLYDIERALVGSVLATHPSGVAIAHGEGIGAPAVESDDLRAIMLAAETCRDRDLTTVLVIAKRALVHAGRWGGEWTDESLVRFARERRDAPIARGAAKVLAEIHDAWGEAVELHGPMYMPPVAFGKLNPVRMGLALARLSKLAGLPVEWIQVRFAQICQRQDDIRAANHRGYPLIINQRGAA